MTEGERQILKPLRRVYPLHGLDEIVLGSDMEMTSAFVAGFAVTRFRIPGLKPGKHLQEELHLTGDERR